MTEPRERIGFIGLGRMGRPMAVRLLEAGYPLTVYNRTRSRARQLELQGASVADTPQKAAERSDIVITMVADPAAVETVLLGSHGLLAGAHPGLALVEMSTIGPSEARRMAEMAREAGVPMLDAPVLGSVGPAAAGTLGIVVGGEETTFRRCEPVLRVLGGDVRYLGGSGQGAAMKLVVNTFLGLTMEALGEALALGERNGLERRAVAEVLGNGALGSPFVRGKLATVVERDYGARFALKHMEKDLGLALDLGAEDGVSLPVTSLVAQLYRSARVGGLGEADFSAIVMLMESFSRPGRLSE